MNNNTNTLTGVTAVPFNQQTQTFTPAATSTTQPKNSVNVLNYKDNPDGTTTNYLSDGTTSTVSYTKNADGSLTPTEIPRVQPLTAIGTSPLPLPTQPPTQIPQTGNQAEQILAQTAVADTEAQKASQSLSKGILELIPQLQGQTQELATQQRAVGLPAMKQNLQNLNNQILQKQAELNQDEIRLAQSVQNIEDKPIAMEFITGQQQSVQRNAQIARALKASEIGVLNATAIGMQGNIALAEQTAKQAVETKYAPYKEALETYKLQLEALTPLLNADEKKQAREQEIKTKLAFNDIEKREKRDTANNSMIINAIAQGAPANVTARATELMNSGADEATVAQTLGMYAGDYWGTKAKIAQYNKTVSASLGDGAGAVGMMPGQSVAQAYLDQFNAGALELGDIYTKIGSSKDAQKIKNEFAQLVAAQGGKRVLTMDDDQIAAIDAQIKNVNDLIGGSGYNYKVISGISQGGALGIGGRITGAKGDALSIAENLIANQTLQSLADAKAKGITFGALSGPELNAVASAASRVASKAIVDKETGKLTGFSGSETGFKKDLETIKEGLEKSKTKKTGLNQIGGKVDAAINILNQPDAQLGGYQFNN